MLKKYKDKFGINVITLTDNSIKNARIKIPYIRFYKNY